MLKDFLKFYDHFRYKVKHGNNKSKIEMVQ